MSATPSTVRDVNASSGRGPPTEVPGKFLPVGGPRTHSSECNQLLTQMDRGSGRVVLEALEHLAVALDELRLAQIDPPSVPVDQDEDSLAEYYRAAGRYVGAQDALNAAWIVVLARQTAVRAQLLSNRRCDPGMAEGERR